MIFTCACNFTQAQVNIIATIAGNGTAGYCCDGEPATNAELNSPDGICLDAHGNLYIADGGNNRIRNIILAKKTITTIAGTVIYGFSGDGGPATDAKLFIPDAVCTDTAGNIYIADALNHRIRKVTVSTGNIETIVGNGTAGNLGDGNPATDAEIRSPTGVYVDASLNVYVTDIDSKNVRKISANGIITTVAGSGALGYSGDGGPATDAKLNFPEMSFIDNFGNIVITDEYNHVLRQVNVISGIITTIAGTGIAGYSGDGGLAIHAKLNYPHGIYIDKSNNIFIAEYGNGTIREIDGSSGIISTVAGNGTPGFSGDDGPATNAQLIPEDLAIDENGIMYIADYENNRIRIVYSDKLRTPSIIMQSEAIKISPNPAQDELTIENASGSVLCIYNILGKELYRCSIATDKETLPIKGFPVGLYLAEFTDEKGLKQTIRFVKNE